MILEYVLVVDSIVSVSLYTPNHYITY